MANDKNFISFPNNIDEALALIYIQNKDLSSKTPEEIYDIFAEAKIKIHQHKTKARNN